MNSEFSGDDPSVIVEPVERRDDVRGPMPGMVATLPGASRPAAVVEAGLKGIFVETRELDRFALGDRFETVMSRGETQLACTVEVVRKESSRRQGLALRVVAMTEEAETAFEAIRR